MTLLSFASNRLVHHRPQSMAACRDRAPCAAAVLGLVSLAVLPPQALAQQGNGVVPPGQSVRDLHRPDPCEQLFDVPGVANGLIDQCEGKGGGAGVAKGDFNGDTYADLAIGAPNETANGQAAAGAVHVIMGGPTGLTSTGNQLWTQESSGIPGSSEAGDRFGTALASGDFDGDTYSDLAIGIPNEDLGGIIDGGRVVVIYGSSVGLSGGRVQEWTATNLNSSACAGGLFGTDRGCRIGAALVWGDYDDDGRGDLTIGMPSHAATRCNFECVTRYGAALTIYGTRSGLTAIKTDQLDYLNDANNAVLVLTAGDLNGDFYDDLVVGLPMEGINIEVPSGIGGTALQYVAAVGKLHIDYGGIDGLSSTPLPVQTLAQYGADVAGGAESGDRFGWSLAIGDFNNDGYGDLVVGVPFEDVGSAVDAGAVQVFTGSPIGPRTDNDVFWDQSVFPTQAVEAGDLFGWSLAAGRFNSGFFADLAIGAPGEDFSSLSNPGAAYVAYGSSGGIQTSTAAQTWTMVTTGIARGAVAGDQFGFSLTAWNFGNSDRADLVIGIPFRDVTLSGTTTTRLDAGAILVLYGQLSGLSTTGNQLWTLESSGILGTAQSGGRFGYALY